MITTYILLKVEHSKPIKDITDHAANRVSTISNVEGVTVSTARPCFIDEDWYFVAEADSVNPERAV